VNSNYLFIEGSGVDQAIVAVFRSLIPLAYGRFRTEIQVSVSGPATTRIYDRSGDRLTLEEIERV
jgi:hypothetical protein